MSAVSSKFSLSIEEEKDYWRKILATFPAEQLTADFDFEYLDKLRHSGILSNISISDMSEYMMKRFADMVEKKNIVFLEEVREFIDSSDEEIDRSNVPQLKDVDFDIEFHENQIIRLKELRQKRVNRTLYLQGKKPEPAPIHTKGSGQA